MRCDGTWRGMARTTEKNKSSRTPYCISFCLLPILTLHDETGPSWCTEERRPSTLLLNSTSNALNESDGLAIEDFSADYRAFRCHSYGQATNRFPPSGTEPLANKSDRVKWGFATSKRDFDNTLGTSIALIPRMFSCQRTSQACSACNQQLRRESTHGWRRTTALRSPARPLSPFRHYYKLSRVPFDPTEWSSSRVHQTGKICEAGCQWDAWHSRFVGKIPKRACYGSSSFKGRRRNYTGSTAKRRERWHIPNRSWL